MQHLYLNLRGALLCAAGVATISCGCNRFGEESNGAERRPKFMRKVINEFGADLSQAHHLRQVAQENPRAVIPIRCCGNLDVPHLVRVTWAKIAQGDFSS